MKALYPIFDGKQFVGFAEVLPGSDDKHLCLNRVKVQMQFRRRGYGQKLLHDVLRDADSEQVTLFLEIRPYPGGPSCEVLAAWYKRNGFRESDRPGVLFRHPEGDLK